MNELQIFKNNEFGQIRVLQKNGQPWFIAKDICDCLEIINSRDALARLDDDEKGVDSTDTPGGKQEMQIINEAGLYSLVLSSRKPEAKQFKRWVTHKVLPSIRKNGMYATDELLDNPDLLIAAATKLKEERAARLAAEKKIEELKPAAEFYHQVADSKDAIAIGDAAKVLNMGVGRNRLFEILRKEKILMSNNIPYQEFIDRGYFRTIEQKWTTPEGETRISIKTLVYQKGLNYIRKIVQSA